MNMNSTDIRNLSIDKLFAHPENPRKDLGDLTELSESIRENGIMQNLTVVPKEDGAEDEYTIIIGHRRCEAARMAGITELPCKIVSGLTRAEILSIMLCENMQRADITPEEQGHTFNQLLLCGMTEDDIAKKTGFSKRTVAHRINISKLSEKAVSKASEAFQLSMMDYIALEQIKSIDKRNEVLSKATSSSDLQYKAKSMANQEAHEEEMKAFTDQFNELNIKPAPKSYCSYNGKWKTLCTIDMEKDKPEDIVSMVDTDDKTIRWVESYGNRINIVTEIKEDPEVKKENELRKQEEKERKEKLGEALKNFSEHLLGFIQLIVEGKITTKTKVKDIVPAIWSCMLTLSSYNRPTALEVSSMTKGENNKSQYFYDNEKKAEAYLQADADLESVSIARQMIAYLSSHISVKDLADYNSHHNKAIAYGLNKLTNMLIENYTFSISEEEASLLDGTFEYYVPAIKYNNGEDDEDDEEYIEDEYEDYEEDDCENESEDDEAVDNAANEDTADEEKTA